MQIAQKLYDLVNNSRGRQSFFTTPELDEIRKPMLQRPFDPTNLVDIREKPLTSNLKCTLVSPLQHKPGCAIVTSERLYFQPSAGVLSPTTTRATSWVLADIVAIARRYNGLKDSALEIYWKDGTSVLLAYERQREREKVVRVLPKPLWCHTDRDFVCAVYQEWQQGGFSNYEYLLALNSAAGRTFQDLSRYPVFPWVIADYKSSTLDLHKESTFRDLSKPMGALNQERLEYFQDRLKGMQEIDEPFLYGTHYSAPGYILYYLVRSMPEHMLCLQNGKFDSPDRMFYSIAHCFSCALTNHADVKELIPEFYAGADFDFLINARSLQLGARAEGDRVNDVELPNWARSPRDFLKKNRKALESDICTHGLPAWIDLIFGIKSRGAAAMDANNLFHHTAYLGPAAVECMPEEERMQVELQAVEFGIVPDQLFGLAHPARTQKADMHFISATLGKIETDLESDGLTDGDSTRQGEQAWELLDPPSTGSQEDRTVDRTGSNESTTTSKEMTQRIGFGAAALAGSAKRLAFKEKISPIKSESQTKQVHQETPEPLATPGGKARASWAPGGSLDVPNSDSPTNGSPGLNYRRQIEVCASNELAPNAFGEQASIEVSPRYVMPNHGSEECPSRLLPLSGTGDLRRAGIASFGSDDQMGTKNYDKPSKSPQSSMNKARDYAKGWDMNKIETAKVHSDSVSGCSLLLQQGQQNTSFLTTVSLDGTLLVQNIALGESAGDDEVKRRGFTGTLSRFAYSVGGLNQPAPAAVQSKLSVHRRFTASDPLACLSLSTDGHGGHLAFAGGHDDVVLAYGINSSCAVASVYSHRDAVTGLDVLPKPTLASTENMLWPDKSTHIMVSGSWDATVKVWSVAVSSGETVSINREPLAELFDADSTIVCLSAIYIDGTGVAVSSGCSDGSFIVWLCHDDGTKVVIHKEAARRGSGACSAVKWSAERGQIYLFTGFSTGKLASFVLSNGGLSRISVVSVGVAVQCLEYAEGILLAGCDDGGLRLLPIRDGASFDGKPTLWTNVNGKDGPGLTCVSVGFTGSIGDSFGKCLCATGATDGSVAVFELKKVM
jgi:factor associated with neutral sphingomyelinase activation